MRDLTRVFIYHQSLDLGPILDLIFISSALNLDVYQAFDRTTQQNSYSFSHYAAL